MEDGLRKMYPVVYFRLVVLWEGLRECIFKLGPDHPSVTDPEHPVQMSSFELGFRLPEEPRAQAQRY